jgi:glutamate/tyrosine decarboxylase-like PLP-dependent enzyme
MMVAMSDLRGQFEGPLGAAFRSGLEFVAAVDELPVAATVDRATLRARLDVTLGDEGVDATRVVEELVAGVEGGILGSAGPRFFGWVIGGSLPAALAADWLTSAWDQNAGMYACGPAAAVVEEVAGEWLKELLRIPASSGFALVTGCQMAHVTCLAAARHAVLARCGWDVERDGLSGAPAIRVLTSTEVHGTVPRALRFLGIGERSVVKLAADEQGRLREDALEAALVEAGDGPVIVVLQAGDLNMGAYDDFARLIPLAKRHGAWVHVDGAFGLWAAASERLRYLMAGAEAADSWATDGHKWLNVPYDCGYAFVADLEAHRAAFSMKASYLTHATEARDQLDWTPEWSRRGRGFATYAALRQLGRGGVARMIEQSCDVAAGVVARVGALEGAEVVWSPQINQGMVRFLDPREGAAETDHDVFTERVMAGILASGEAFFTGTTWRGKRAMRVSVSNWQTDAAHVERVVRAVGEVLRAERLQ